MAILGKTSVSSLDSGGQITQNGGKRVLDETDIGSTVRSPIVVETNPTAGSTNAISSGAVWSAINKGGFFLSQNNFSVNAVYNSNNYNWNTFFYNRALTIVNNYCYISVQDNSSRVSIGSIPNIRNIFTFTTISDSAYVSEYAYLISSTSYITFTFSDSTSLNLTVATLTSRVDVDKQGYYYGQITSKPTSLSTEIKNKLATGVGITSATLYIK